MPLPPKNVGSDQVAPRLPLAVTPENRDNTTGKDAKLVNALLEKGADGQPILIKRPGYTVVNTPAVGVGQGLYNWEDNVYSIIGTTLYKGTVAQGGSIASGGGRYKFSPILGANHHVFIHNRIQAYVYDQISGVIVVGATGALTTTGNTHTSTLVDGLASTTGVTIGAGISGSGIPTGAYVTVVNSGTSVTISVATTSTLVGTNVSFVLVGVPVSMVPGSAYLDSYTFVMTPGAAIYNSNPNDVSTAGWPAINYLIAQIAPDGGIFLAKQLVYIIAFKAWSTEVFYDASNAVASVLGQVQAAKLNYGCVAAETVAEVEGKLVWVSTTRSGNIGVMFLEDLKARSISTPAIERILQTVDFTTDTFSWGCNFGGHEIYVLTNVGVNITLVYDFSTHLWSQWTDPSGNYFPFVEATFDVSKKVLLQHISNGTIVKLDQAVFADAGAAIPVTVITPSYDGGTSKRKLLSKLDFIGDQVTSSTLSVQASDDDYQTWSNVRTVDLSKKKPQLPNCGSFVHRAYKITHTTTTALRLRAIEMQIEVAED